MHKRINFKTRGHMEAAWFPSKYDKQYGADRRLGVYLLRTGPWVALDIDFYWFGFRIQYHFAKSSAS